MVEDDEVDTESGLFVCARKRPVETHAVAGFDADEFYLFHHLSLIVDSPSGCGD
jgi:hypothetical protein